MYSRVRRGAARARRERCTGGCRSQAHHSRRHSLTCFPVSSLLFILHPHPHPHPPPLLPSLSRSFALPHQFLSVNHRIGRTEGLEIDSSLRRSRVEERLLLPRSWSSCNIISNSLVRPVPVSRIKVQDLITSFLSFDVFCCVRIDIEPAKKDEEEKRVKPDEIR